MSIDATREILRLDPEMIDPAPTLLTRGEGDAEITSICRLDGGRRLVALLSPDRLFRSDLVQRILDEQGASGPGLQPETNAMADEQFIIFRLGNQDYGIPIAAVSEIARPPEHITRLPKSPAFIDGVMNLRGSVVPIVDLRRRFDLNGTEQLRFPAHSHAGHRRGDRGISCRQRLQDHESTDRCHLPGARTVARTDAADLAPGLISRPMDS